MKRTTLLILSICSMQVTLSFASHWAFDYAGQDSRGLLFDSRVTRLISSDLGISPKTQEMSAFQGVPAAVTVQEGRYIWSSSCQAHQCPFNRGFFWLDTETGDTLAARAVISYPTKQKFHELSVLTIGGNMLSVESVSAEGNRALHSWITANKLHFDRVEYRRAGASAHSAPASLDPAAYSAADSDTSRPVGS